jgi:adenylate cyclase
LDFGLSLHLGDVFYGNIGASDRLDFTVVGPAVNEASRIQDLCRPLGCDVLISRRFRDVACGCHGELMSLGTHTLRGVRTPQELFTLVP